ncbi:hypothetical protein NXY15_26930 [Bacteroides thetaiotaomicron]|nr:hypothetical protein NXY15_26930 [Bacteroides thetaiotaomicron]
MVDKTSNFVYGRPNSNIFLPSKYLMDCFAADMNDSRFRYSFISGLLVLFYTGMGGDL